MVKAYLSTQPSSLSPQNDVSAQMPRRSQLKAQVCGSESTISFFVQITLSKNNNLKTTEVLVMRLEQNWCSSQRTAS